MKKAGLLGLLLLAACRPSPETVIEEASIMEERGDLAGAQKYLEAAMARSDDPGVRQQLVFEADRLRRIRLDYPYDRDRMWEIISRAVRDVTREEFDRWVTEGRFDVRTIDGRELFVNTSRSNLFWRYPEIAARRIDPPDRSTFERAVLENLRSIQSAAGAEGKAYVLPKRFQVTMSVTTAPDAAPPGKLIRAWLPVPRAFGFQTGFELLSSSPQSSVDDEDSPIRSAYMERQADQNGGAEFTITYAYTHAGIRFMPDDARAVSFRGDDAGVAMFLHEGPHVTFSKEMRTVSDEILSGEENPLRKARMFYDWISENIRYSYAVEYSTIRDIGAYCLERRYGDCGQEALLYITLCRLNGIPARWQSGWFTFPGGKTIHDWTEIYIEPWGWMPVDPYMGIFAMQYMSSLSKEEQLEVRDFYFCGLDQYRIAANSDHSQTLRPPKESMRSDNVDFQRGELEYDQTNIYFDMYRYQLTMEEPGGGE